MLVHVLYALVAAALFRGTDADADGTTIPRNEELDSMVSGVRNIKGLLHKDAWPAFVGWFDEVLSADLELSSESALFPRYSAAASFAPATFAGSPGLKTLRAKLDPGEPFMVIPCGVMMDMESAFNSGAESAFRKYAEEVNVVDGTLVIAMHLTWETLHLEKSFFKHYIRLLPHVGPGINPWQDLFRASKALNGTISASNVHAHAFAAVLHLGGNSMFSWLTQADGRQKQAADTASQYLLPLLEAELVAAQKEKSAGTLDAAIQADLHALVSAVFSWAWDIVMTRSWSLSGKFKCPPTKKVEEDLGKFAAKLTDPRVLVPLASMTNHDSRLGAKSHLWTTMESQLIRGRLFVNGAESRSFGDQLFVSYRDNDSCNIDLLFLFGFALQDPWLDCVKYTVTYPNGTYRYVNLRDNNFIPEEALRRIRHMMLAGVAQGCEETVAEHWDKPLSLNTEVRALRQLRRAYTVDLIRVRRSLEVFRDANLPSKGRTKSKTLPVDYASLLGLITPSSEVVQAGLSVARGSLRILEAAIKAIDERWLSYLNVEDQQGDSGQLQKVFQDNAVESRVGAVNVQGQRVCVALDITKQSINPREQLATSMAGKIDIPAASETPASEATN